VHRNRMQDFRKLRVWKRAHAFAVEVRQVVRSFPRRGYSDLKSQIIRAAESIVSNIVEGCGAATRAEFARFLDISIKSTSEVDYRLELARDLGALSRREWTPLSTDVVQIRKSLFALRREVLAAERREREEESGKKDPRSQQRIVVRKPMTDDPRPRS